MIELKCEVCAKTYYRVPSAARSSKHCSRRCHNKIAGVLGGRAGKGVSRGLGRKRPDLVLRNLINNPSKKGPENKLWKAKNQAYSTVHLQIDRLFNKGERCERCGAKENLQWSNKDHLYSLKREDWQVLCAKCHKVFDREQAGDPIKQEKNCKFCGKVIKRTRKNTKDFVRNVSCSTQCYNFHRKQRASF